MHARPITLEAVAEQDGTARQRLVHLRVLPLLSAVE